VHDELEQVALVIWFPLLSYNLYPAVAPALVAFPALKFHWMELVDKAVAVEITGAGGLFVT